MDCEAEGFEWVCNDPTQSVTAYLRKDKSGGNALIVCNFTPIQRSNFLIGVPDPGTWIETLNTDAEIYGGGNRGNLGSADTIPTGEHGYEQSLSLTLPPLSTIILHKRP
jgi:1,4-alpha-glucan branching enzyme